MWILQTKGARSKQLFQLFRGQRPKLRRNFALNVAWLHESVKKSYGDFTAWETQHQSLNHKPSEQTTIITHTQLQITCGINHLSANPTLVPSFTARISCTSGVVVHCDASPRFQFPITAASNLRDHRNNFEIILKCSRTPIEVVHATSPQPIPPQIHESITEIPLVQNPNFEQWGGFFFPLENWRCNFI